METATISPRYQVVIPRAVWESLGLGPGQRVQVIPYEGRIELIPLRSAREMRGFLKGIDTSAFRERVQCIGVSRSEARKRIQR